ncbi:hypothetical protein [Streptomyces griseosporeus]|uniref:hypothetical protein n=1 Tax=Streptomyces griseosporeus TaxID=1910 RepID=UPI0036844746
MRPIPASLLSDGPVARLLDIDIAVQESKGELTLDSEIQRYIRSVGGDWIANWHCSVRVATGLLEVVADFMEGETDVASVPQSFLSKVRRACGDMEPAEYLRTLAEVTRLLERQGTPEYAELPMASREFQRTFPYLFGLNAILMDEGGEGFAAVVRRTVTNEHPYCHGPAAAYTTEAQRALVLFPGPDALRERLSWATRDRLQELIETINDHMQRDHS